jgi:hypothetical protein
MEIDGSTHKAGDRRQSRMGGGGRGGDGVGRRNSGEQGAGRRRHRLEAVVSSSGRDGTGGDDGCNGGGGHEEADARRTSLTGGTHRWGDDWWQARKYERGTHGQRQPVVQWMGKGERNLAQYHARRNELQCIQVGQRPKTYMGQHITIRSLYKRQIREPIHITNKLYCFAATK